MSRQTRTTSKASIFRIRRFGLGAAGDDDDDEEEEEDNVDQYNANANDDVNEDESPEVRQGNLLSPAS